MGGLSVRDPLPTRACTTWRASAQPAGAGLLPRFLRPVEGLSTTRDSLSHHTHVGVPSVQVLCAVPRFRRFRRGRSCGIWFGRLCGQAHGGQDFLYGVLGLVKGYEAQRAQVAYGNAEASTNPCGRPQVAPTPLPRAGLRRFGVGGSRRVRLCVGLGRPAAALGQAAQAHARARNLLHHEGGATLRARVGQGTIPGQSHLVLA